MILIAVLCVALALVVFGDYSWSNVLSRTRNDLVFEGRNKDYGAYQLRKEDPRNMMWAILLTIGIVTPALLSARWLSKGTSSIPKVEEAPTDWTVVDVDITPKDEKPVEEETAKPGKSIEQETSPSNDLPPEVVDENVSTEPVDVLTEPVGTPSTGKGPIVLGGGGGTDPEGGSEPVEPTTKIFDFVSVMPQFVGGDEAKLIYVQRTARYPYRAKEVGVEGTIYVQFVVDENGYVQDAKVIRSVLGGADLEKEALRVVNNMPQWIPGSSNGHPVRVRQVIPVKFILSK